MSNASNAAVAEEKDLRDRGYVPTPFILTYPERVQPPQKAPAAPTLVRRMFAETGLPDLLVEGPFPRPNMPFVPHLTGRALWMPDYVAAALLAAGMPDMVTRETHRDACERSHSRDRLVTAARYTLTLHYDEALRAQACVSMRVAGADAVASILDLVMPPMTVDPLRLTLADDEP